MGMCAALFRSMHLNPEVIKEAEEKKAAIHRLLGGQSYCCLHVNSWPCTYRTKQTHQKPAFWNRCISNWMRPVVCDEVLFAKGKQNNVMIVGQGDALLIRFLKKLRAQRYANASDVTFSLQDIGDLKGLAGKTFASREQQDWYGACYAYRAALSWQLCAPGYAQSYAGEYWSGFTMGLLRYALANPDLRANWTATLFT